MRGLMLAMMLTACGAAEAPPKLVTEEIVLRIAHDAHQRTGMKNLCMAGGVALNCVANGRIVREGPFEQLWVQPAAGTWEMAPRPLGTSANSRPADGDR